MGLRKPSGPWAPWIATGIIGVLVVGAIVSYTVSRPPSGPPKRDVARGVACTALTEASDAFEQNSLVQLDQALHQARARALFSLRSSAAAFGTPEQLALEAAALELPEETDVLERKLQKAVRSCSELSQ